MPRRLWALYLAWEGGGPRPSEQLGIQYPWVALDLDTAAHALGKHVEAEVDKRRRAEEKELNPDPPPASRGKAARRRKHVPLSEERGGEIWTEVVARIIDRKLVWHVDATDGEKTPKGESVRWRLEKPVTGDKQIDEVRDKGARRLLDQHGRVRAEFDAGGQRTFFWKPKG